MNSDIEQIIKKYINDSSKTDTIETKLEELDDLLKNAHIQPQYSLRDKNINKVDAILDEKYSKGKKNYKVRWVNKSDDEESEITWEPIENISRYTLQLYQLSKEANEHNNKIKNPSYNAHLYLRTSTPRVNDGQVSIDVQRSDLKKYCMDNKIHIKSIKFDEGTSARNMKNLEGLDLILDNIEPNEILMVWDISRFSRNTLQALHLLESLSLKNIHTYFFKENVTYDSAMAKHYIRQALSTAQLHSDTVSEKVKAAIQYKRSKGNYIGQAKYGFKVKKIGGIRKLVKHNKEQQNIKLIKNICNYYQNKYEDKHLGSTELNTVATMLNGKGMKFRGRPFTRNNVSLLMNR
jgi:DNA invertase Pin-like site-specific DNA recombinase